ncbi:MAG: PA2169 family four-helix-bundle protein [Phenylobacterium sp.]|nr:PA2169 family four-helix-bundle protein [Phenylobacterium sp.]
MHPADEHAVSVLNGLIERTLDSVNGYRTAADHIGDPRFKAMFEEKANERLRVSRELQAEVRMFGVEAEDGQSLLGRAHNAFVGIKDAVTGGGSKAIIDEVERGENALEEKYEAAAEDAELPEEILALVSRLCQGVRLDHDQISAIKAQLH